MFDPLAKKGTVFLWPALHCIGDASGPTGNIERLGPVGGWGGVSVTAPLPERLSTKAH